MQNQGSKDVLVKRLLASVANVELIPADASDSEKKRMEEIVNSLFVDDGDKFNKAAGYDEEESALEEGELRTSRKWRKWFRKWLEAMEGSDMTEFSDLAELSMDDERDAEAKAKALFKKQNMQRGFKFKDNQIYKVYYSPITIGELKKNKRLTLMTGRDVIRPAPDRITVIVNERDLEENWLDHSLPIPEHIMQAKIPPQKSISEKNVANLELNLDVFTKRQSEMLTLTWKYFTDLRKDSRNYLLNEARRGLDKPKFDKIRVHAVLALLILYKLYFTDAFKEAKARALKSFKTERRGNVLEKTDERIRDRIRLHERHRRRDFVEVGKDIIREAVNAKDIGCFLFYLQRVRKISLPRVLDITSFNRAMLALGNAHHLHLPNGSIVRVYSVPTQFGMRGIFRSRHHGFWARYSKLPYIISEFKEDGTLIVDALVWKDSDEASLSEELLRLMKQSMPNYCRKLSELNEHIGAEYGDCGVKLGRGEPIFFRSNCITHYNQPFTRTRHSIVFFSDRNVFAWKDKIEVSHVVEDEFEEDGTDLVGTPFAEPDVPDSSRGYPQNNQRHALRSNGKDPSTVTTKPDGKRGPSRTDTESQGKVSPKKRKNGVEAGDKLKADRKRRGASRIESDGGPVEDGKGEVGTGKKAKRGKHD
ncbi:hypothetical protein HDU96_000716 [Phlyctochytrium bullatum]|nr:hypothetical protein HDU96_000716 [Phlyctochytrium bullatum]